MRRWAMLLLTIATITALAALSTQHWRQGPPEPSVTYTTVTLEPPVPTLPRNTTVEWVGEARLLVYVNGKLVVNETDPPTWNWYYDVGTCLLSAYDIVLYRTDGSVYSRRHLSTGLGFRFANPRFVLGSGYWGDVYTAVNVSQPELEIPVMHIELYKQKLYLLSTIFSPKSFTLSEVGLYADAALNYYGWVEFGTVMLFYDVLENPVYVHEYDNLTIVLVVALPNGTLGNCLVERFSNSPDAEGYYYSYHNESYVYIFGPNVTQKMDCRWRIVKDVYDGYHLLGICHMISHYDGNVTEWYTGRPYLVRGLDIMIRPPYRVRDGQPVVLIWTLEWR